MARPLTPRQAAFIREYLIDLNAAAAARRAGYSEKTADRMGYENLRKPEIAAALETAMAERAETTRVTAQDVLERLWVEAEGKDRDTSSAARIRAAELLGKHLGMFTDRVELSGEVKSAEPVTPPERALSAAATALRRNGVTN